MPWQEFTELSAHAAIKGSGFLLEEEVQQIGSGGITPTAAQAPGITQKYRSKQCHGNSERKMEFQEDLGIEPSLELMMAHSYSLQHRAAALWGLQGFFGVCRGSLGFSGVIWGFAGFLWGFQWFFGICRGSLGFAGVHWQLSPWIKASAHPCCPEGTGQVLAVPPPQFRYKTAPGNNHTNLTSFPSSFLPPQ